MKKLGIITFVMIGAIVLGIFLIKEKDINTDVTETKTMVGFVLNGSIDDGSWSQAHYEGMEKVAGDLNLQMDYRQNIPGDATCLETIEELIGEGCKIIICNSYEHGEWEQQAAEKHPEIYFYHATGTKQMKNLSTYFGRIYQMRYLSGIVAGLQTETNKIGYVAAFPIDEVNRGINAFARGVRSVNQDARIYVEWSGAWEDDEINETVTRQLLEKHDIDVLTMHIDSLKALEVAQQNGVWSIGYNMDNYEKYPDTFLTAPVWKWENFYEQKLLECLQGKFQEKHYWEGAETGIVALAPLSVNVKPGIAEVVEKEKKRLEDGSFDVFYGPVSDRDGNIRVKEGENMSDEALLNNFDWYVEGVVTDGEE